MNLGGAANQATESGKTDHNPPETFSLRRFAAPFLIFVLALGVRLIGLIWGLPDAGRWYSYHPDETTHQIVGAVVSLLGGDFNPHFFNYPSLSVYATWFFYQLLAGFGLTSNVVSPSYPWPLVRDIIFAGRLFSVFCGALTAPLIYGLARHLKMGRWSILAGILAALAPGHVQHSHFATVDVPATFFVTWCLYLTIRAQNPRGLLLAALVAGLAAGTKYNAGLVLLAPITGAIWCSRLEKTPIEEHGNHALQGEKSVPNERNLVGRLVLGQIVLAALAFALSTPYALLAPHEFWGDGLRGGENGFAYELLVHPKIGSGEIFQGTGNGWIYHLTFNLPFVLTWPLVFAAMVGIGFTCKKRDFWPILAFAGVFFLALGFSQVRFMRYLLPLAPFLCLLASYGASQLPFSKVWGTILMIFALVGCSNVLWPFTQIDPRDQAASGQNLGTHPIALAHNPWFYSPPFQAQGFNAPVAGFPVTGFDLAKIRAIGGLFAVSEFEWRETVRLQPNGEVARLLKQLPRFTSAKNRVPFALPGRDFVPQDYLYTNPETRIYMIGDTK